MKITVISIVILLCMSCATTNISYDSESCRSLAHCGPTADCSTKLYNNAVSIMSTGEQQAQKGLYTSAAGSYRKARHMLACANAKLAEAQLRDFHDWQVANVFGMGEKIKDAINECDMLAAGYQWR